MKGPLRGLAFLVFATALVSAQQPVPPPPPEQPQSGSFRFKSGVELINVTVTVTDASGRFVPNLRQDDFVVYEDDERQNVTHFSADRVPVSLGILLDTSQSMQGEKFDAARAALDQFLSGSDVAGRRIFSDAIQQHAESAPGMDQRPAARQPRIGRRLPTRRNCHVRRDRRCPADDEAGAQPEAGDRHSVGRQRHDQRHAVVGSASDHPPERGAGLRGRHRLQRRRHARRPFMELQRQPRPQPFPMPPGRRPWPPAPPVYPPSRSFNRCSDPSTCGRYAISPTTAAGGPSWCAIRATSIQPPRRSPMS
jgi:hypothetical protein